VTLPLLFIPSVAALLWLFVDLDGEVALWTATGTLLVINGIGHFIAWRWPRHARAVSIWRTFGVSAIATSSITGLLLPQQQALRLMLNVIHGMYMVVLLVWLYSKTPVQPLRKPQDQPEQIQST
jgi:hypothetical protein